MTTSKRSDRLRNIGEQLCPLRDGDGLSSAFPPPDYWRLGGWASTQEEADAEVAEFMAAHPNGGIGSVLWCYPGEQPRTCSYCGGVNPDDAVVLVQAGWEVVGTDKGYKRYLEPPGYREYLRRLMPETGGIDSAQRPQYPSPVPPVKLYTSHFSPDQRQTLNAVMRTGVA